MKHIKRISALLLAAMMLLSLCACSSTGNRKQTQTVSAPGSSYNYSYAVNDMAMGEAMATEEAEYGLAPVPMPTNASAKTAGGEADSEPAADTPDKIIYSADVTVETTAFDETIGKVSGLVEAFGGFPRNRLDKGCELYAPDPQQALSGTDGQPVRAGEHPLFAHLHRERDGAVL